MTTLTLAAWDDKSSRKRATRSGLRRTAMRRSIGRSNIVPTWRLWARGWTDCRVSTCAAGSRRIPRWSTCELSYWPVREKLSKPSRRQPRSPTACCEKPLDPESVIRAVRGLLDGNGGASRSTERPLAASRNQRRVRRHDDGPGAPAGSGRIARARRRPGRRFRTDQRINRIRKNDSARGFDPGR